LDSRHARDQAPVHLLIQFVHRASRPFVMMAGSHGVGGPPPARCLTYPRGYYTLEGKLTPTIPGRRHPRLSLVPSNATEISADELGRLLEDTDAATPLVIVDVRNRDEFDRWRIEGRRPVTLVHTPYFDIIEAVDSDDLAAAAARYAAGHWQDQLSRHALVVTVCARGDGSAFVAEGLRRLGYRAVNLRGGMLAWADRYVTRFVTRSDRLTLAQIARPARGCLSYLIASGGEAAVVDPLRHGGHYEDLAAQLGVRITAVIDTHAHADHISSGSVLARRLGVGYHLHPYDALHPMDAVPGTVPYQPIRDGQTWRVGEVKIGRAHV